MYQQNIFVCVWMVNLSVTKYINEQQIKMNRENLEKGESGVRMDEQVDSLRSNVTLHKKQTLTLSSDQQQISKQNANEQSAVSARHHLPNEQQVAQTLTLFDNHTHTQHTHDHIQTTSFDNSLHNKLQPTPQPQLEQLTSQQLPRTGYTNYDSTEMHSNEGVPSQSHYEQTRLQSKLNQTHPQNAESEQAVVSLDLHSLQTKHPNPNQPPTLPLPVHTHTHTHTTQQVASTLYPYDQHAIENQRRLIQQMARGHKPSHLIYLDPQVIRQTQLTKQFPLYHPSYPNPTTDFTNQTNPHTHKTTQLQHPNTYSQNIVRQSQAKNNKEHQQTGQLDKFQNSFLKNNKNNQMFHIFSQRIQNSNQQTNQLVSKAMTHKHSLNLNLQTQPENQYMVKLSEFKQVSDQELNSLPQLFKMKNKHESHNYDQKVQTIQKNKERAEGQIENQRQILKSTQHINQQQDPSLLVNEKNESLFNQDLAQQADTQSKNRAQIVRESNLSLSNGRISMMAKGNMAPLQTDEQQEVQIQEYLDSFGALQVDTLQHSPQAKPKLMPSRIFEFDQFDSIKATEPSQNNDSLIHTNTQTLFNSHQSPQIMQKEIASQVRMNNLDMKNVFGVEQEDLSTERVIQKEDELQSFRQNKPINLQSGTSIQNQENNFLRSQTTSPCLKQKQKQEQLEFQVNQRNCRICDKNLIPLYQKNKNQKDPNIQIKVCKECMKLPKNLVKNKYSQQQQDGSLENVTENILKNFHKYEIRFDMRKTRKFLKEQAALKEVTIKKQVRSGKRKEKSFGFKSVDEVWDETNDEYFNSIGYESQNEQISNLQSTCSIGSKYCEQNSQKIRFFKVCSCQNQPCCTRNNFSGEIKFCHCALHSDQKRVRLASLKYSHFSKKKAQFKQSTHERFFGASSGSDATINSHSLPLSKFNSSQYFRPSRRLAQVSPQSIGCQQRINSLDQSSSHQLSRIKKIMIRKQTLDGLPSNHCRIYQQRHLEDLLKMEEESKIEKQIEQSKKCFNSSNGIQTFKHNQKGQLQKKMTRKLENIYQLTDLVANSDRVCILEEKKQFLKQLEASLSSERLQDMVQNNILSDSLDSSVDYKHILKQARDSVGVLEDRIGEFRENQVGLQNKGLSLERVRFDSIDNKRQVSTASRLVQGEVCLRHLNMDNSKKINNQGKSAIQDSCEQGDSKRSRRRILRLRKQALQGLSQVDQQPLLAKGDLSRYFSSHQHKNEVSHVSNLQKNSEIVVEQQGQKQQDADQDSLFQDMADAYSPKNSSSLKEMNGQIEQQQKEKEDLIPEFIKSLRVQHSLETRQLEQEIALKRQQQLRDQTRRLTEPAILTIEETKLQTEKQIQRKMFRQIANIQERRQRQHTTAKQLQSYYDSLNEKDQNSYLGSYKADKLNMRSNLQAGRQKQLSQFYFKKQQKKKMDKQGQIMIQIGEVDQRQSYRKNLGIQSKMGVEVIPEEQNQFVQQVVSGSGSGELLSVEQQIVNRQTNGEKKGEFVCEERGQKKRRNRHPLRRPSSQIMPLSHQAKVPGQLTHLHQQESTQFPIHNEEALLLNYQNASSKEQTEQLEYLDAAAYENTSPVQMMQLMTPQHQLEMYKGESYSSSQQLNDNQHYQSSKKTSHLDLDYNTHTSGNTKHSKPEIEHKNGFAIFKYPQNLTQSNS